MTSELLRDFSYIEKCMQPLKVIHQCNEKFANDIDVFKRNDDMLAMSNNNSPVDFKKITTKMKKIQALFELLKIEKVPCHNDTTPGNFIYSNGDVRLIDWEYSGNNDPLWDLACMSMEANFTQEQDLQMFKAYFSTWEEATYQRFLLYKPVVEYWVALWARLQINNQNYTDNLSQLIALEENHFANCVRLLDCNEYKVAFKALKTQVIDNEKCRELSSARNMRG